jgi:hypothetical protein
MKRNVWEKIDDYLDGIMDEQSAKRFEQELKNDSALREDFTIMKGLREMLKRRECLEFIESVKQARENYYQEKAKNSKTEI